MSDRHEIVAHGVIEEFVLAGNAVFTIESPTGCSFTYRVRKGDYLHLVALLTGPDNEHDYTYIGTIYHRVRHYNHGIKSTIGEDAKGVQAFAWFWHTLFKRLPFPEGFRFYHEGRCGRCGRRLTTPESIESGIGPVCADRMAA